MKDRHYTGHARWLRYVHDYYHRVEHHGYMDEAVDALRSEPVLMISNHATMVEALVINYFVHQRAHKIVSTLIFREAFKIPMIREFFRSCQCLPISVETGAEALKKRPVLVFPEGMDFIGGFVNHDRVTPFHRGFLRMAKLYLEKTGKKYVTILPIAHSGFEHSMKVWVLKNPLLMHFVKPLINYPYLVVPKLPFFLPTKVAFHWGMPQRVTLDDLKTEKKIRKKLNDFHSGILAQKYRASCARETAFI
jgi:1-acyl-sn-glycerol-3-phosphate acyltransferase